MAKNGSAIRQYWKPDLHYFYNFAHRKLKNLI